MHSDVRAPSWLPRPFRPAPSVLREARAFTRQRFGARLEEALELPGWLHPDQAAMLCWCASKAPQGPLIELGSFKGKSAVFIATGMREGSTLHAVDPHTLPLFGSRDDLAGAGRSEQEADAGHSWPVFLDTIEKWGLKGKVVPEREMSHDFRAHWSEPASFIWIDADHTYGAVKKDIEDWADMVKPGGYLGFHDTHERRGPDPHQKHLPGGERNVYDAIVDSGLPEKRGFETTLRLRNAWFMRRNG